MNTKDSGIKKKNREIKGEKKKDEKKSIKNKNRRMKKEGRMNER